MTTGRGAGAGPLTLPGITVDNQRTTSSAVLRVIRNASAAIESTTLRTVASLAPLVTRGPVQIGPGVTLRTDGAGSPPCAPQQGPGGAITCGVPPTCVSFATRCCSLSMPGCDCGQRVQRRTAESRAGRTGRAAAPAGVGPCSPC